MRIDPRVRQILDETLAGQPPDRGDCAVLLSATATSPEAALIRATGDAFARSRFENHAVLLAQIGIESGPCPARCRFCTFSADHTELPQEQLAVDDVQRRAGKLASGDVFAIFLLTLHDTDWNRLLSTVASVRARTPRSIRLVINTGDFDRAQAEELRSAGCDGAYHVQRLREGIDTALEPRARLGTIEALRAAGLDWYTCCEPIGPEHSPAELVEQIFTGIDLGCFQHAAMRRVALPRSPLASRGQISTLRLAQVVAVISLATAGCAETRTIAVREPNLLGLAAGANSIYAETGTNPRDTVSDTAAGRGLDVASCREIFAEAGFARLLRGDGASLSLSDAEELPAVAGGAC